jgi:hypothetical protein
MIVGKPHGLSLNALVYKCHTINVNAEGGSTTITYFNSVRYVNVTVAAGGSTTVCGLQGSFSYSSGNTNYVIALGDTCNVFDGCPEPINYYTQRTEQNGVGSGSAACDDISPINDIWSSDVQNLNTETTTSILGKRFYSDENMSNPWNGNHGYFGTPRWHALASSWGGTKIIAVKIDGDGYVVDAYICSVNSPTPTATPTPTPTPFVANPTRFVLECVSGDCAQGTGRTAGYNSNHEIGDIVGLNNVGGCWEILSVLYSGIPMSTITQECLPSVTPTPTPTATASTIYKYLMNPCDEESPNFVAASNVPRSINTTYTLTGSAYQDWNATVIGTSTASYDTWIGEAALCSGGGGGCLVTGTQIEMHDGTFKNIEDISVGDALMSRVVEGMPNSDDEATLESWEANNPTISTELTQVVAKHVYHKRFVYSINSGLLTSSAKHLHYIKRGDLNMVRSADELQIGDFLIDKDHNLIEITSLIKTHGHFQVFKLDVEEADLYIANGIITHNDKPRGGL